jgi:hypothetical protein
LIALSFAMKHRLLVVRSLKIQLLNFHFRIDYRKGAPHAMNVGVRRYAAALPAA